MNNVVTYDCVIGVTNADYKLKPGMTANVSIIVAQREDVLIIPNAALRFHPPDNAMVETNSAVSPPATNGINAAGRGAGKGTQRAGRVVNARFFTQSMCFQVRVPMPNCRRCRSRRASATAFRPRCSRGWMRARRW